MLMSTHTDIAAKALRHEDIKISSVRQGKIATIFAPLYAIFFVTFLLLPSGRADGITLSVAALATFSAAPAASQSAAGFLSHREHREFNI
ncbi:MAG: hypothetical protein A2Y12_08750 [Planctomycetes bacterium GWF2_42_9]|nr:MAG: hypothetical protein A2Y12_08750 [Planctomycetes bacterium GWF2_42_9]HAL45486.1 hypothetical protein [Phycisphaerales bacterium]